MPCVSYWVNISSRFLKRKCISQIHIWNPSLLFLCCFRAPHSLSPLSQPIIWGVCPHLALCLSRESLWFDNIFRFDWLPWFWEWEGKNDLSKSRMFFEARDTRVFAIFFSKPLVVTPKPWKGKEGKSLLLAEMALRTLLLITSPHSHPVGLFWKQISQHLTPYNSTCVLFPVSLTSPNFCLTVTRNSQK